MEWPLTYYRLPDSDVNAMSHAILERNLRDQRESSDHWYFRHHGETFGPYDRRSLRDVIVSAGIRAGLELRRSSQCHWLTIPIVGKLIERIDAGLPPISTESDVESDLPSRYPVTPRSTVTQRSEVHPSQAPVSAQRAKRRYKTPFLRSFARKEIIVFAAMLLIWLTVNAVVVGSYAGSHAMERAYSREIQLISDEFQQSRRCTATDLEWDALQSRAEATLSPIVRELSKSADTKNPIRQHLLWAARDYMPKMLRDARLKPSEAEQLFERHMEESRRLLGGAR